MRGAATEQDQSPRGELVRGIESNVSLVDLWTIQSIHSGYF